MPCVVTLRLSAITPAASAKASLAAAAVNPPRPQYNYNLLPGNQRTNFHILE